MRAALALIVTVTLSGLLGSHAWSQDLYADSHLGRTPPEITTDEGVWIGVDREDDATTLEARRGRVVLLLFTSVY